MDGLGKTSFGAPVGESSRERARASGSHCASSLGHGAQGARALSFFGDAFPYGSVGSLLSLCTPTSACCLGVWTWHQEQQKLTPFPGIFRHFQAFPGISSGFGERQEEPLLFQAVPCQPRPHPTGRCQEWGDTMRCPPQHPQWTQIQGNLWIHPRGSGGSGWVPHPTAGKMLLVRMNKCKRNK